MRSPRSDEPPAAEPSISLASRHFAAAALVFAAQLVRAPTLRRSPCRGVCIHASDRRQRRLDRARNLNPVVSPTGDLIARHVDCKVVVSRRDGSDERAIEGTPPCSYAIAAWSPDGRRLVLMRDIGGHEFEMIAVSVTPPFSRSFLAVGRVNHARSWPWLRGRVVAAGSAEVVRPFYPYRALKQVEEGFAAR
jgi:hypothetical protein